MVCKGCWIDFHHALELDDPRSIEFFTNSEGRGTLTECKLCKEQGIRSKMIKLNFSWEDVRFCDLEHFYAYKAARDIESNSIYNLCSRVRHYTESSRNAGHSYDLNQSRIFHLAQIQIGESNEDLAHALEPQYDDQSNQDYTYDEVNIIMRATYVELTETEEQTLQRILTESFDMSHPNFDRKKAMENLQRNFAGTAGLCESCIMVKTNDDLRQHENLCKECYEEAHPLLDPETEILPPPTLSVPEALEPNESTTLPELEATIVAPIKTASPVLESAELIQLLQEQIRQQAQIITLLQEQAKTFEHQEQTIKTLQNQVSYFENFHHRLRDLYTESTVPIPEPSNQDAQNF